MLVEPPDFRRAVALAVIALQLGERVFRIRQGHRVDGDRSLAALIHIGHGQAFQTVRSDSDTPPNSSLDWAAALVRSEEHTSELQSLMRISYAIFCLKKKIKETMKRESTECNATNTHEQQKCKVLMSPYR